MLSSPTLIKIKSTKNVINLGNLLRVFRALNTVYLLGSYIYAQNSHDEP